MATRTQAQLISGIRLRANVPNSKFVDDTVELPEVVQKASNDLYDLVVSVYKHYYVKFFTFSLVGGQSGNSQSLSALTGGFYKDNTLEINPGVSGMGIVDKLGAFQERASGQGLRYEIIDTPPTLYVYPPEQSKGNYRLAYTPDAPIVDNSNPLDATLSRWYEYIEIRGAIYIHQRRGKLQDAQVLTGDISNPQPGTLAWEKQRVLNMAQNKTEMSEQVPMARRRSAFWKWDDEP